MTSRTGPAADPLLDPTAQATFPNSGARGRGLSRTGSLRRRVAPMCGALVSGAGFVCRPRLGRVCLGCSSSSGTQGCRAYLRAGSRASLAGRAGGAWSSVSSDRQGRSSPARQSRLREAAWPSREGSACRPSWSRMHRLLPRSFASRAEAERRTQAGQVPVRSPGKYAPATRRVSSVIPHTGAHQGC